MGGLPLSGASVPLDGDTLARLADPFARGGAKPLREGGGKEKRGAALAARASS